MVKTMHARYKETQQKEVRRYSETDWRDQKPVRKPVPKSSIPARASAHPSAITAVRPKYLHRFTDVERVTHLDVTRLPTLPQKSDVVETMPGNYQSSTTSQRRTDDLLTEHILRNVEDLVSIDEIDTLPPGIQARLRPQLKKADHEISPLSEVDTLPNISLQSQQEEVAQQYSNPQSASIQLLNGIEDILQPRKKSIWYVSDNLRWWLLYPGRLEFLLWLIGVIVLICVTGLFVFIATVSMGLFGSGGTRSITPSAMDMQKSTCIVTTAGTITSKNGKECLSITALSSSGLQVTMMNGAVVVPGTTLEIEGHGFSAHGNIHVTHDGDHACIPAEIQANGYGEFTMTVELIDNAEWLPGTHQIILYDVQSHHSINLPIVLTSSS
jgi:hypothetical protein